MQKCRKTLPGAFFLFIEPLSFILLTGRKMPLYAEKYWGVSVVVEDVYE